MHTYDAHGLPYFISSSGVMQFREACYTAVSCVPYLLLPIYTITILATFGVTIFEFFHPGPQPICKQQILCKIVSEYDQGIPQSQTADGLARKSHTTIRRHQEDKLSKATSSQRGSSTLYGIYIGFCPRTEFYKIL